MSLAGKVVAFTGKLESFTRAEAASKVKDAGGVVSSSVTKKTTHLVVGSDGKVDKAAPGTVVWTETEFTAAITPTSSVDANVESAPTPPVVIHVSVKDEVDPQPVLAGKVVAFTGKLESFTRAEAASKVKDAGGVVSSSVTKKTTHLVVGSDGKVDKAAPGTVVWTETEFTAAITPTSSVDANVESAPTPPVVIHVSVKDEVDPQPVLAGKVVAFTGKLESFTRAEAASKVKDAGGVVSSSVTKKTTHLVVGSDGKVDKAAPGTVVWTETEFTAALAKATSKAVPSPTSPVAMSVKNKATSAAVGKGKKRAAAAPPTTPEKKPKTEATIKSSPVRVTTRKPDKHLAGRDQFTIVDDFTTDLMQTNIGENNNKFYILQLVATSGQYHVFTRWGRLGDVGQQQLADCGDDLDKAILLFEKKFKDKTKNKWSDRHAFVKHDLQYQLVELDASESGDGGGGGDAAMGKLSAAQVHKGQVVLDKLLVALEHNPGAVTALSGEYYSLIPTLSGRQRPPPLNSIELIHEKAALLDFWLRMGFDDMEEQTGLAPIEGIMDLPLPSTLLAASSGITQGPLIEKKPLSAN
ncbi:hypothetical protein, variant [Aphanomyces astaci]|uniref:NAD(+) ADP-ribosyltransferase n=1 Tax=Aphanomyces astaci TaxID=112090 RepID=W4FVX7_APHAT|nr:hypothetical protein, variant [Aphanomyces astaci]ETV71680.1 hypothetical protein, variant [Aphanomyces astaci]|eukprot:XP_009838868.1 hypothetical protein, variant [Aphanomyces astaci]